MNPRQFSFDYTLYVLFPPTAVYLITFTCSRSQLWFQLLHAISVLYYFISYGVFVIIGIVLLTSPYDSNCFNFFQDINTFNNFILIIFGIRMAIVIGLIGLFLVCCLPCLCLIICGAVANQQKRDQLKRNVVSGLSKTTFDHLTDRVN